MRHLASVVHAAAGICALLIACGSHRRDFSADIDSAGRGGADEGPRRAAVAPDVSSSGAAGHAGEGAFLPATAGAGAAGTAGAAGAPTTAHAGSAGAVAPDGLTGQSGSALGQAGAPIAVGEGGHLGSSGSPGSAGSANAAGTVGAAGLGGAPELPEEGTAGSPWAPAAELCPTSSCTGATVCQYRVTTPAVSGARARVTWTLPVAAEDYVVEKYDAAGCVPTLAIDDDQTVSVSWEIASTSVCIVNLGIHRQSWLKLGGEWPSECTHPSVEVSP